MSDVPEADVDPRELTVQIQGALEQHANERKPVDWFGSSDLAAEQRQALPGESALRQSMKFLARMMHGELEEDEDWGTHDAKRRSWAFDRFVKAASEQMRISLKLDETLFRGAMDLYRINAFAAANRLGEEQESTNEQLVIELLESGMSNEEIARVAGLEVGFVDDVWTKTTLAKAKK